MVSSYTLGLFSAETTLQTLQFHRAIHHQTSLKMGNIVRSKDYSSCYFICPNSLFLRSLTQMETILLYDMNTNVRKDLYKMPILTYLESTVGGRGLALN